MLDRRALIKLGLYGGSGGLLYLTSLKSGAWGWAMDEDHREKRDKDEHDCTGGAGGGTGGGNGGGTGTPPPAFTRSLPIPPVKQKVDPSTLPNVPLFTDGIPTSYYELLLLQAPVSIMQGNTTMIWGFDGKYLGPTLEANIGERVVVRINNMLGPGITSIIHHHGAHVTSEYDGSALWSQQIQPAMTKDCVYPNDDDIAATHWYHDHDIDHTGHNVFMGLEGCFLLHDHVEQDLDKLGRILPGNPANDPPVANPALPGGFELPFDIPLVVQDRAFNSAGQLVYNPFSARGFLGDHFLVNGAIQPTARVANRKYRLRFLNGSNARFYQLSLRTDTGVTLPIYVIGSDGGLYKNVFPTDSFQIGPAERIEVIVDFSSVTPGPNTRVFLNNLMPQTDGRRPAGPPLATSTNVPQTPGPDGIGSIMTFDVQFSAPDPSTFNPKNPQTLRPDLPVYDPTQAVIDPKTNGLATRDWRFERGNGGEWLVNGMPFDPGPPPPFSATNPESPRVDATVTQNSTEIWRLINGSGGWWHPVHIHRNQFQILDRRQSGSNQTIPLLPNEQGLKDVFALEANHEIRVITKFTNGPNTTQTGKYVMHCHNVEHEDMRMMVVWEVV